MKYLRAMIFVFVLLPSVFMLSTIDMPVYAASHTSDSIGPATLSYEDVKREIERYAHIGERERAAKEKAETQEYIVIGIVLAIGAITSICSSKQ